MLIGYHLTFTTIDDIISQIYLSKESNSQLDRIPQMKWLWCLGYHRWNLPLKCRKEITFLSLYTYRIEMKNIKAIQNQYIVIAEKDKTSDKSCWIWMWIRMNVYKIMSKMLLGFKFMFITYYYFLTHFLPRTEDYRTCKTANRYHEREFSVRGISCIVCYIVSVSDLPFKGNSLLSICR